MVLRTEGSHPSESRHQPGAQFRYPDGRALDHRTQHLPHPERRRRGADLPGHHHRQSEAATCTGARTRDRSVVRTAHPLQSYLLESTDNNGSCSQELRPREIRNVGASVRARLQNLSRETGQSFDLILTRYALERLLYRLSTSAYADRFVLKGAMLLTSWFTDPHRPTRDRDLNT